MRIAVIIFSVFLAQTSASFYDDLTNSISSVRAGVGKLFSDASVDLKETYHCTVSALWNAFSSDTTVFDHYQKCQENKVVSIPLTASRPVVIYIAPYEPTPKDVLKNTQTTIREPTNSTPKTTNENVKENDRIEKEIHTVEKYLIDETRNLTDIGSKLEHELKDLSNHVNDDFIKLQNEQKQMSIEKIMQKIDKLHGEELVHENKTENEIREVFDKLVTKLDKNNTDMINLKEEIQLALSEFKLNKDKSVVEQELQRWKEEELKSLMEIEQLLKNQALKTSKPQTTIEANDRVKSTTITPVFTSKKPRKSRKRSTAAPNEYDSLLNKDPKVLDQALKLVDSSKKTEALMASLLKKEKTAPTVFDHPELLR